MIASAPLLIYVFVAMSYTALGASVWSPVRTDDAAWQSACGHSKRVGAVCLDAHYGDRNNYKVQMNAVQNVIFSGNGKYLMAYCPNRDKGEYPYIIEYINGDITSTFHVVGRKEVDRCCYTYYVNAPGEPAVEQCVEPSVTAALSFPDSPDEVTNSEEPSLSPPQNN